MAQQYNNPLGGTPSTIGSQFRTDFYKKKALIEAEKEMYFGQMADVTAMPKHFGKKIKQYLYLPLLDDANVNDQGIDASGASTTVRVTFKLLPPNVTAAPNGENIIYITGEGANLAAAEADAEVQEKLESAVQNAGFPVVTWNTNWDTTMVDYRAAGWSVTDSVHSDLGTYGGAVPESGNLYGSSKDVGTIPGKMPALTEAGGRVNRVGFKRVELEGTLEKFGFFEEYTKESLDFDTDEELEMHVHREMVRGANEITEDLLQIDLLSSAGVVRYGGTATSLATMSGETGAVSTITYNDLMRMSITLDNNRCPKMTKIISGSRMIDTKTINSARYLFIGSELIPTVKAMTDLHSNPAFVSVEKYASAGNIAKGEIGTVDQFRIIVVPEMMCWEGVGVVEGSGAGNAGYRTSYDGADERYNVYPMLCVGAGSFTTIGFQTDGKSVKFKIKHSKPESDISYGYNDPYGEKGFMSIKWYYGFMLLRPERIALAYSVAEW